MFLKKVQENIFFLPLHLVTSLIIFFKILITVSSCDRRTFSHVMSRPLNKFYVVLIQILFGNPIGNLFFSLHVQGSIFLKSGHCSSLLPDGAVKCKSNWPF